MKARNESAYLNFGHLNLFRASSFEDLHWEPIVSVSRTNPTWMTWTGWVLTLLPALGLIFSAVMKFVHPADLDKEFDRLGWHGDMALALGIVELVCVVLYLVPQTNMLGAILLTGYLGGAIATHVRISDNFIPPIIMGVMIWLGLYFRDPRLRALVPLKTPLPPGEGGGAAAG
jgi:hypothetical protein